MRYVRECRSLQRYSEIFEYNMADEMSGQKLKPWVGSERPARTASERTEKCPVFTLRPLWSKKSIVVVVLY
jgi:hypothetical protein